MINPIYNPYLSSDDIPFEENLGLSRWINLSQRKRLRRRMHFKTLKRHSSQSLLRRRNIIPYHIHKSLRIRARTL